MKDILINGNENIVFLYLKNFLEVYNNYTMIREDGKLAQLLYSDGFGCGFSIICNCEKIEISDKDIIIIGNNDKLHGITIMKNDRETEWEFTITEVEEKLKPIKFSDLESGKKIVDAMENLLIGNSIKVKVESKNEYRITKINNITEIECSQNYITISNNNSYITIDKDATINIIEKSIRIEMDKEVKTITIYNESNISDTK